MSISRKTIGQKLVQNCFWNFEKVFEQSSQIGWKYPQLKMGAKPGNEIIHFMEVMLGYLGEKIFIKRKGSTKPGDKRT